LQKKHSGCRACAHLVKPKKTELLTVELERRDRRTTSDDEHRWW